VTAAKPASDVVTKIGMLSGDRATFMNCRYQVMTPYQGTGTCDLSSGARYQVHLGG
jgi:hypothetical protein